MNSLQAVDLPIVPDIAGSYADRIREVFKAKPGQSFTVPELVAELKCTERRVREGLDRLAFLREVRVAMRHVPNRRGQPPRAYSYVEPSQASDPETPKAA